MEETFKEIKDIVISYLSDALKNRDSIKITKGEAENQYLIEFEYKFYPKLFEEATGDLNHAILSRGWKYKYKHDEINDITTIIITT